MNARPFSWIPIALLALCPCLLAAAPQPPAAAAETIPAPPDVAAPPADAQVTASGLASKVLAPGTGTEHPVPSDMVKVHYSGWTTDGKMFDSSVVRGRAAVFPLHRVIAGWTEGVQLMVVGEKRRFWIPAGLAYEGKPDRPQGMLVFDVELLDILRVPPVPADVAAPPADAQTSESGLAWKVLKPGTGARRATKNGVVRVHYTGWTTDGKMFDSSQQKGAPSTFELTKVIAGWTEGLQLMTEGESRRFWIPKKLAYRGAPGKPEGMLVFDVELLEIVQQAVVQLNGLMATSKPNLQRSWPEAYNYCANLDLAGFSDWRLPTLQEMKRIDTRGRCAPDGIDYPLVTFGCVEYWSADENGIVAYAYGFDDKDVLRQDKGYAVLILCVRDKS